MKGSRSVERGAQKITDASAFVIVTGIDGTLSNSQPRKPVFREAFFHAKSNPAARGCLIVYFQFPPLCLPSGGFALPTSSDSFTNRISFFNPGAD